MKYRSFALGVAVLWLGASLAAADTIKLYSQQNSLRGDVVEMSRVTVTVETRSGNKKIPVNDIVYIRYDGEPSDLSNARLKALAGQYGAALKQLQTVDTREIDRRETKQDVEFYKALCTAKLAIGGAATLKTAVGALQKFIKNNGGNFHYYEANELYGDVAVSAQTAKGYALAIKYYDKVAGAPFPDAKVRMDFAKARALQSQGKHAEAQKLFTAVLNSSAQAPRIEILKLAATLGKARSLAADGKPDEGVQLVDNVIQKANPRQVGLHAQAYLAKGDCHRIAKRDDEAIDAYLHVDLLYFQDPAIHAEALARLKNLWLKVGKPDRSREAQTVLKKRYGNSRWAKSS